MTFKSLDFRSSVKSGAGYESDRLFISSWKGRVWVLLKALTRHGFHAYSVLLDTSYSVISSFIGPESFIILHLV